MYVAALKLFPDNATAGGKTFARQLERCRL
jgi:hypothetical protein